jgi:hypothetical protein
VAGAAKSGRNRYRRQVPAREEKGRNVSVARRLGADEDKARFEAKLKKIAKAKPK